MRIRASGIFCMLLLPPLFACMTTEHREAEISAPHDSALASTPADPGPTRAASAPSATVPSEALPTLALGTGALPPAAVQGDSRAAPPAYPNWTARGWLGVVTRTLETDNVTFSDATFGTSELSWDDPSFGLGFDIERRFSKLLGLDLGIGYTNMDIDFSHSVGAGTQTDSLGSIPIWLALNFHLVASEKLDLYLGPQIAYFVYLNDLSYDVSGVGTFDFDTSNEFPSLGFLLGVDYWLNDAWGLNFAFRFQDADADSNHNLPLDPTFITLGVSRRF